MLQGPAGNGLDQIYSPEQAANGAANITDAQYDMLHVRSLDLTRRCQNTVPSVALPRRLVASWRLCSCGRSKGTRSRFVNRNRVAMLHTSLLHGACAPMTLPLTLTHILHHCACCALQSNPVLTPAVCCGQWLDRRQQQWQIPDHVQRHPRRLGDGADEAADAVRYGSPVRLDFPRSILCICGAAG